MLAITLSLDFYQPKKRLSELRKFTIFERIAFMSP